MFKSFLARALLGLLMAALLAGGLGTFQQVAHAAASHPHQVLSPFSSGTCGNNFHSQVVEESGWVYATPTGDYGIDALLVGLFSNSTNQWCGVVAARALWQCFNSFAGCPYPFHLCASTSESGFVACRNFTGGTSQNIETAYSNSYPDTCEQSTASLNNNSYVQTTFYRC